MKYPQIYLAGKVRRGNRRGPKWSLARMVSDLYPVWWRASDQWEEHDLDPRADGEHERDADWLNHSGSEGNIRTEWARNYLHPLLESCDACVAYIDRGDCYGSIAEAGYFAGSGKPVLLVTRDDWDYEYPSRATGSVRDACWLLAEMPGVSHKTLKVNPYWQSKRGGVYWHIARFVAQMVQCDSTIEQALWWHLTSCGPGVELPVSQLKIGNYRADIAYREARLVVECDGHDYHKTREQRTHDAKRDRYLAEDGWRTARFTGSEIHADTEACALQVHRLLRKADEAGA